MGHYFTNEPEAASAPRTLTVNLHGRQVDVTTDAGVFSATRLDPGTTVLLSHAGDPPPSGTVLDLGCGWGPISLALAMARPQVRVLAVDVNTRALELTAANAERLGLRNVETFTPETLLAAEPDLVLDAIWSNPPIRVGKAVLHELLRTWLPRLAPGASAQLVVAKNLGADSLQRWITAELALPAERTTSVKGYRILVVTAPAE
ncbi:class I SAM-dependent methyltransferase [Ruania zhangjianzhongii]|uniref:class I SAM-dependent methyltransferase n=1 Tax=Ruania zhangjianzhongii TaxID=2603206 RepID=UPI001F24228C|nr:methyltransferase [Ruania zhangjianzhongii]